jgi:heptosyltransferase-3
LTGPFEIVDSTALSLKDARPRPRNVSILVVQKNNIGDLILVTPFLSELRRSFSRARIDVLANSYNAAVLDRNPDVDNVIVHIKQKHHTSRTGLAPRWIQIVRQTIQMRRTRYDYVFLLTGRFSGRYWLVAKLISPRKTIGFSDGASEWSRKALDVAVAGDQIELQHVVPRSFHLLWSTFPNMDQTSVAPQSNPCRVFPDETLRGEVRRDLVAQGLRPDRPIVALQISARRPRQRWPAECFAAIARGVRDLLDANSVFFWAPGPASGLTHPGDDERVEAVLALCRGFPTFRYPTVRLPQLVAGLSLADVVVSADGGAMHVAAACGKPVVALFGDSDFRTWHPWCREFHVIQAPTRDVASIGVDEVLTRVRELLSLPLAQQRT